MNFILDVMTIREYDLQSLIIMGTTNYTILGGNIVMFPVRLLS
jgi:hypothetical protein